MAGANSASWIDAPEVVVAEDLGELRAGELGVDQDGVRPGRGGGQHRLDEPPVVPAHHSHAAARADPEPVAEGRRQPLAPGRAVRRR